MSKFIVGNGAEDAKIMIVTDYPSKEEATTGKAGNGYVGRMISGWLKDAGVPYDKTYRTCFIKHEFTLPRAKNLQDKALHDAHEAFRPDSYGKVLADEIAEIGPNVILSVGEFATRYLTGRRSVQKLRGSIIPLCDGPRLDCGDPAKIKPHIRVVPIIHPRDVLQKWIHNSYTSLDVARAVKLSNRTDIPKEPGLLWICWDYKSFQNWWDDRGRKGKYLTLDIETYNTFITCISFCVDGKEALSVPLVDKRMSTMDRALILRGISKILRSPIPKVNQNIDFDDYVLRQWGFRVENIDGDTMLLGHTIYPELPKGLDFYTSIYTEIAYYKDDGRDFSPKDGWDTLYYYNAKDSLADWLIYEAQEKDARESGVWSFYRKKVWPLFNVYKRMDDRGILIDPVEQQILLSKYTDLLETHNSSLERMVGHPINFNSPKAVADVVYEELGYPKQYKTDRKTGIKSLTTGEETLEELILNNSKGPECDNILWKFLWCRKLFKIRKLILVPYHLDGRMRTNSKLTGTKSGRTSMSKTIDRIFYVNTKDHPLYNKSKRLGAILSKPLGLSFQTIGKHGFKIQEDEEIDDDLEMIESYEIQGVEVGKDIRRMYIPSKGYTFVEGDGGQAEARVVCILAEDWETLDEMERKTFKRNRYGIKDDVHTKMAMLILNREFEEITEQDRQDSGKKPQHAGNYDMGPGRLSLMAHIPFAEAQIKLTRFHNARPKVRDNFHFSVRSAVTNNRILKSPHGRVRQFFDKLNNETYKQAYSFIPQAVVSDHTKMDTIEPLVGDNGRWHEPDVYFIAESHDSAMFEVRNECVDDFLPDFKAAEESPILFNEGTFIRERELIIPIEIKTSTNNWYEMKEHKF